MYMYLRILQYIHVLRTCKYMQYVHMYVCMYVRMHISTSSIRHIVTVHVKKKNLDFLTGTSSYWRRVALTRGCRLIEEMLVLSYCTVGLKHIVRRSFHEK